MHAYGWSIIICFRCCCLGAHAKSLTNKSEPWVARLRYRSYIHYDYAPTDDDDDDDEGVCFLSFVYVRICVREFIKTR